MHRTLLSLNRPAMVNLPEKPLRNGKRLSNEYRLASCGSGLRQRPSGRYRKWALGRLFPYMTGLVWILLPKCASGLGRSHHLKPWLYRRGNHLPCLPSRRQLASGCRRIASKIKLLGYDCDESSTRETVRPVEICASGGMRR
jgi:hypothetical protein